MQTSPCQNTNLTIPKNATKTRRKKTAARRKDCGLLEIEGSW